MKTGLPVIDKLLTMDDNVLEKLDVVELDKALIDTLRFHSPYTQRKYFELTDKIHRLRLGI